MARHASADHTAWDALPGPVLLLDAQGSALHVNPAFAAFARRDAAHLLGRAWQELLDADSRRGLLAQLAQPADFATALFVSGSAAGEGAAWVEWAAHWQAEAGRWLCLLHDASAAKRSEAEAREQARLFRLLADNVPVLIAYYRASDFQCQFANKAYARTFGTDERAVVGKTFAEVIGNDAAAQIEPRVQQMLHLQQPAAYERELAQPDGSTRFIDVNLLPHVGEGGDTVGCFVLISDITRHRLAERAVRESEERLAKFLHASAEGIVFHKDGVITDANPPLCALIGYTLEELRGRPALDFVAPDQVPRVTAVMQAGQEISYETAVVDKAGRRIAVEFIVRTMLRNGERLRMTIVRDIRDRQAAQARIHHLAHHDALTGLPNRMSFMEQLQQHMVAAEAEGTRLALLFIDLDHFKRVNDSLGHLVGDTLLRTVAARILASLRATDVVARFGGDEFMVLLHGGPSREQQRDDVDEVARKLLAAIEVPVNAEGRPISVTPSIGVAFFPGDAGTPDELIKNADSAMYLAKSKGRANHQFFDRGIADSAYAALVLEGQLAHALERGEFELYFQPQLRLRDGVLVSCEALLRWNHPERGLLLPDQFIPVAERQRLMLAIGQWALTEAARCALRWDAQGLAVAPVAVNLSTVQFQSVGFVEAVAQVLADDGDAARAARLIELELTERMLMDDIGEVKHRLLRLKAMGLGISVDDFGTGYSSLGHLKELPIDKIKIDRSFVHDLPDNRDSAAITRAIVQLGLSLGMTVTAEGVETEAQRAFLLRQGCDQVQGLLIGPPMPLAAFEDWARQRRAAERGAATSSP
ncbi:MAG: EAL domain-containing protein [Piscinibacter sp.]|uniref:sensor domain-containing protein n=1 Tax=Piscinibacter sp. TaxID=1903157 RepID=UPI001B513988|nr:EAL domain-containing protein [Piscinibacter sp.]MBP5990539.1 EAL domain-containing protein [Piscinibacter sp.]MBP6027800.1 EAL domain-containing protein [Piscinibacter sp.]